MVRRVVLLLLVVMISFPVLVPAHPVPVHAQPRAGPMEASLPEPTAAMGAASDGTLIYTFGGYRGGAEPRSAEVLAFDPVRQTVDVVAAMPAAASGVAAVWHPGEGVAYLFGGYAGASMAQILRFDPATATVSATGASLPTGVTTAMAAWDGRDLPGLGCAGGCFYILGGNADGDYQDSIVRYHPTTGTVTVLPTTLPHPLIRAGAGMAPGGDTLYIFGGWGGPGQAQSQVRDEIWAFDPVLGTISQVAALPTPAYKIMATWSPHGPQCGGCFLIVGGQDAGDAASPAYLDDVLAYVPGAGATSRLGSLANGVAGAASAVVGNHVYALGGTDGDRTDAIQQFTLRCHDAVPQRFACVYGDGLLRV